MASIKKVVLVTAEHHPYHKLWVKLAERLSKDLNTSLDVKIEDYVYINEYGDKDEYGMAWLPQILAEYDDGTVKVLLSQLPLNQALQPDEEKAIEIMKSKALGS
ncbi:hypothetical protein TCELL_0424 [Thermogladius calderae 1633]|uniref:Uncharacterized protein n=1 Tax=Thermogladius calderae (strain DSM 22663 / VKM B-2946 / 1633) TaxID=1184251 RepID=I3TDL1_THEC1|nr:hypothetical protein [Thermogladius calderae]AFK50849.1 hypothetical protein TCELL_0424 [Thermogladius calderae 1633]